MEEGQNYNRVSAKNFIRVPKIITDYKESDFHQHYYGLGTGTDYLCHGQNGLKGVLPRETIGVDLETISRVVSI